MEHNSLRSVLGELLESPFLEQFALVWDDIGMEEHHRKDRRETMRVHLQNLLEEMLQEEIELKNKLVESVERCSLELEKLCQQLSLPNETMPEGWSLIQKEKELRTRADTLTKEKHDRVKRFKRLTEMECAMCESVGEERQLVGLWQAEAIPSEEDLSGFRRRIEELEQMKDQRQVVFFKTRERVLQIWEELEFEPQEEYELLVARGDLKGFVFSLHNMRALEEFYQTVQESAVELEARALRLREVIHSLWERLEVPQTERKTFTQQYPGYKHKVIRALEAEVERLNVLKKQSLSKFIEATRAELHKIWDLCFYGDEQRKEFAFAYSENYNDDLLSAHESELDRMRGFYSDNKEVYKLVEKRENLWKKFEYFEKKASDPNRYNNRGGQLLKEEKQKKQVVKDLPKVEKELNSVLTQWENDHERYFVVQDTRYLDTIERQWQEKNELKEREKAKRQRAKVENTMMEMTYGSKPSTPIKRQAPPSTPTSCPIKMRRIGPSPLVHSTRQNPLTQSAIAHGSKRPPAGPSAKTPGRKRAAVRKILTEKNTSVASSGTDESYFSQPNSSVASTCTYTDFQSGLQDGLNSHKNARSSAIPKSSSLNHIV